MTKITRLEAGRVMADNSARSEQLGFSPRSLLLMSGAVLVTVLLSAVSANIPIVAVGAIAVVAIFIATIQLGLRATLVIGGLCAVSLGGTASTVVPAAGALTLVGIVILIGTGIASVGLVRVNSVISVAGGGFVLASTIASLAVATISPEFAFRGWISLVSPIFAAIAVSTAVAGEGTLPDRRRRSVLGAVIITVILNVVFALRQAIFGLTAGETAAAVAGESTYLVHNDIRLMGTFATNQDFGVFSACLAPALLVLALKSSGKKKGWLLVLTAGLYAAIFLSLTRTALIAGVAAGVLALLLWARGSLTFRIVRAAALVVLTLGLVAAVLAQLNIPRVQSALVRFGTLFELGSDTSFNARVDSTLPKALEAFSANPLGWGAGAAGPVSQQFPTAAPLGPLTTDNGYLMIAIQLGVIGVVAFLVLLLAIILRLGGALGTPIYGPVGAAATIALVISMITAQYWSLLAPMALVAAVVGLGLSNLSSPPQPLKIGELRRRSF